MDQIAAKAFERETQLSSLQLTVDDNSLVGSCDVGYSCAYSSTLSWLTPTLPLMAENNPRVVFERLFGSSDSTDPRVRASRLRQDRSILDSVTDRVRQLQQKLGPADNTQGERLPRVAARRGAADSEGGRTERQGGARRGSARRRSRRVRAARAAALRPAAAGLPVRSDTGDHLHVRPRADRPAVSADRHPRAASFADAPSERSGEDGEVHQHPDVSRQAVRGVSREAARDAGRRRLAARSRDPALWVGHQQQRPPHARPAADAAARRRRRDASRAAVTSSIRRTRR